MVQQNQMESRFVEYERQIDELKNEMAELRSLAARNSKPRHSYTNAANTNGEDALSIFQRFEKAFTRQRNVMFATAFLLQFLIILSMLFSISNYTAMTDLKTSLSASAIRLDIIDQRVDPHQGRYLDIENELAELAIKASKNELELNAVASTQTELELQVQAYANAFEPVRLITANSVLDKLENITGRAVYLYPEGSAQILPSTPPFLGWDILNNTENASERDTNSPTQNDPN